MCVLSGIRFGVFGNHFGQQTGRILEHVVQVTSQTIGDCVTKLYTITTVLYYLTTICRLGQLMTPMIAATSTFCIASHVSYKIREKDDEMNYAIGGFSAGTLYGILMNNKSIGLWLGIGCAIIGVAKKHSMLNGYEIFPAFPKHRIPVYGNFRTPYRNWTLYDMRPKGWVAAEERKE